MSRPASRLVSACQSIGGGGTSFFRVRRPASSTSTCATSTPTLKPTPTSPVTLAPRSSSFFANSCKPSLPSSQSSIYCRGAANANHLLSFRRSAFDSSSLSRCRRFISSKPEPDKLKVWPFVAIVIGGSGLYYLLALQRHEAAQVLDKHPHPISTPAFPVLQRPGSSLAPSSSSSSKMAPTNTSSTPAFDSNSVTVIFVLGGPGAGKGTQSQRLVREFGFTHLSAGDLLRTEQNRPGSEFGDLIEQCIRDGAIVPSEVTVKLLENAMREALKGAVDKPDVNNRSNADKAHAESKARSGEGLVHTSHGATAVATKGKFLIDGFPRKLDQAHLFERNVCAARLVLFFSVPERELERRLLERGKTSGRADDNLESIKKRFRTFEDTSMPVVDFYERQGKVVKVDGTKEVEAVFADTQRQLKSVLGEEVMQMS